MLIIFCRCHTGFCRSATFGMFSVSNLLAAIFVGRFSENHKSEIRKSMLAIRKSENLIIRQSALANFLLPSLPAGSQKIWKSEITFWNHAIINIKINGGSLKLTNFAWKFLSFRWLPETRKKSLAEIQQIYQHDRWWCIQYPTTKIPNSSCTALLHVTKSVTLQYLGNRESYQRSAGVKTPRKNC